MVSEAFRGTGSSSEGFSPRGLQRVAGGTVTSSRAEPLLRDEESLRRHLNDLLAGGAVVRARGPVGGE